MPAPAGHAPYNTNGEGGRPKIYTKEFIDNEAAALIEWMNDKQNLFIEEFCFDRGYNDSRIPEFVEVSERFSDVYCTFKMKQRAALFKGGLTKKFAYPMCALLLSHNHGIISKTENKISGDAANPLAFILNSVNDTSKDLVNDSDAISD